MDLPGMALCLGHGCGGVLDALPAEFLIRLYLLHPNLPDPVNARESPIGEA